MSMQRPAVDMPALSQYFHKIDVIRFFVSGSPAFGHAASTIAILKRFIALGFATTIQVVYHESTLNKLAVLLPGFNPEEPATVLTITSQGKEAKVSFALLGTELEPKPFAISGGFDEVRGTSIPKKLAVEKFVVLQPFSWENAPNVAFFGPVSQPTKILDSYSKQLPAYYRQGYYRSIAQMTEKDWQHLLEIPTFKQETREKIRSAQTLVNVLAERPDLHLCPIYGIADVAKDSKTIVKVASWTVLFNLIAGINYAQKYGEQNMQKGAVVLVLADLKAENYTYLTNVFDGAFGNTKVNEAFQQHVKEHLQGKVKVRPDLKAPEELQKAIKELQPDEILVLSITSLPPDVFDFFYNLATLPSVFEGAGTASMIVNLNKPYLRLAGQNQVLYPTLPLDAPKPGEVAVDLAQIAMALQYELQNWPLQLKDTPATQLGTFISDCYRPTKIAQYFLETSQFFHNEAHDKLLTGLTFLLDQGL
jgi:hypothetical protein